ncbi:hypothetical protein HPB50_025169 [Hyalomma asiaticum]|uniref:Uncharacterized protein n=1 Tax=Hyalomma asiaticum TaxID=266040 RepID=A0ACB7SBT0_HYAAI|nr:hypothetical protein HPB50_025169 [Hyalomma asiaticum]
MAARGTLEAPGSWRRELLLRLQQHPNLDRREIASESPKRGLNRRGDLTAAAQLSPAVCACTPTPFDDRLLSAASRTAARFNGSLRLLRLVFAFSTVSFFGASSRNAVRLLNIFFYRWLELPRYRP